MNRFIEPDDNPFAGHVVEQLMAGTRRATNRTRPFVTLSFAQSLDGSISIVPSASVRLSNFRSQVFTHKLRAAHDAILIGIGTLIADDPRLNVRLVKGPSPQPIVVDSYLRFPISARLLQDGDKKPWVASTTSADSQKEKLLKENGARVLHFPALKNGWVNLEALLQTLYEMGIRNLMVEGGGRIISSFLSEGIADQIVLTIAPMLLGGFRAVGEIDMSNGEPWKRLKNVQFYTLGSDLLVRGDIDREVR